MNESSKPIDDKKRTVRNGVSEELDVYDGEEDQSPPRTPFSLLGNLIFLLTIAIIAGIGWLLWQTWLPQDLSSLPGYREADPTINISELLRQADKNNTALTLSESDINRYIASTLKASQHGILSPFTKPNGVGIRLHDGYMEIIIERQVASSRMQTVSLFVTVVQLEDPNSPRPLTTLEYRRNDGRDSVATTGGTLGRLSVPQGYMFLVQPAFANLARAYDELLSSLIDSGRIINISPGRVDLLPARESL